MRSIKFRAWLPVGPWNEEGTERKYEMVGPDALAFEEYAPLAELLAGCENLMQFTGLHDKNGREIYEGDICNIRRYGSPTWEVGFVKWGEATLEWLIRRGIGGDYIGIRFPEFGGCVEVIGNIWENPDLLEVPHAKS